MWFRIYFQIHICWRKSKNEAPKSILLPQNMLQSLFLKIQICTYFGINICALFSQKKSHIFSNKKCFLRKNDFSCKLEGGTGLRGFSSNLNVCFDKEFGMFWQEVWYVLTGSLACYDRQFGRARAWLGSLTYIFLQFDIWEEPVRMWKGWGKKLDFYPL